MDFAEATTQHRKILRINVHQPAINRTPAGYHAVAEVFLLIQAERRRLVLDKHIQLTKATGVQQNIQPFMSCVTPLIVLAFDALLTAA